MQVGCDVNKNQGYVQHYIAHERIESQGGSCPKWRREQQDEEEGESMQDGNDGSGEKKPDPSPGDRLHRDTGTGLPSRPATFDACISTSALQWLRCSNSKDRIPKRRLMRFISSL